MVFLHLSQEHVSKNPKCHMIDYCLKSVWTLCYWCISPVKWDIDLKKIDVYGKIFSHRKGNFRKDLLSFLPEKKRISIGFEQNSQWHMISRENLFSYGNVWIKVIKELLLSYRNYNSCRILFKNPTRFQNTWHPVGNFSYFPMGY